MEEVDFGLRTLLCATKVTCLRPKTLAMWAGDGRAAMGEGRTGGSGDGR